jgi:hypothetical protein
MDATTKIVYSQTLIGRALNGRQQETAQMAEIAPTAVIQKGRGSLPRSGLIIPMPAGATPPRPAPVASTPKT